MYEKQASLRFRVKFGVSMKVGVLVPMLEVRCRSVWRGRFTHTYVGT